MKVSDFELASITFSANTDPDTRHEFTNVHHGFLSLRGVIPDTWVIENTAFTEHSFSLDYENGVQIFGDPRQFQVTQIGGLDIREESVALKLIVQYLTSISPDTFRLMSAQLELHAHQEGSHRWAAKKFLHPELAAHSWKEVQPVVLLTTPIENMIVNLGFMTGQEVDGEYNDDILRVAIHAVHEPFSNSGELLKWCYEWPVCKNTLLQNLAMLIEDENDATTD